MSFLLDRHSRLPFAAQVQQQAEAHLVAGRLHPGDRLPSVRQLARQLGISRTTAERIHETLCEATLAQSRPRSGAFVATRETEWSKQTEWAQTVYAFLKSTVQRARELGLDATRLSELLHALGQENWSPSTDTLAVFPVLVTQDAFECMQRCLDQSFPARLMHIAVARISLSCGNCGSWNHSHWSFIQPEVKAAGFLTFCCGRSAIVW